MKKEELRHDPVRERIVTFVDYVENNKNTVLKFFTLFIVLITAWGYYVSGKRDLSIEASSLSGKAQNTFNSGQLEIARVDLESVINDYPGTSAAKQALVYLVSDAYRNNEIIKASQLLERNGTSVGDKMIEAGLIETKGNIAMDNSDFTSATNYYLKSMKITEFSTMKAQYLIDVIQAYIAQQNYDKALTSLSKLLSDESLPFNDKSKAEELQAFVITMMGN